MTDKRPMTIEDLHRIAYVEQPRVSPDGAWVAYVRRTVDKMENGYKTNIWLVPTGGGEPVQLTRSGKDSQPMWKPDSSAIAFVSARADKPQLYVMPVTSPGGEPRPLTNMENGATSFAWSPDGTHIAFLSRVNAEERTKEDMGETPEPPKDKLEAKHRKERKGQDEKLRFEPRPMPFIPYRSGTSYLDDRFMQVYVVPTAEGLEGDDAKPRRLTDEDIHHSWPAWSADGTAIYTARATEAGIDEPFMHSQIYRITVEDGTIEQLTDSDTFASYDPWPSPNGAWVAFVRREKKTDDLTWLAVMPPEGGEARELTREFDRSVVHYDWTPDGERVVFIAGDHGNAELYTAPAAGGEVEKMVGGTFQAYEMHAGPNGVAYAATTPTTSTDLYFAPFDGGDPVQLTDVNRDFLDEVIVQETHELRFTAEDGTEIQGWYILPVGYEEGQKAPLALNIHGGPHVMWGPSEKTMFHEWQLHAAEGYAVFYCNPRGSDGYGYEFNSAIHGKWGAVAMDDVMAGVDAFLELGCADPERMAITGGSYGGYLTGWIIAHTDRFAAAVPQRGVYNIASFYGTSDVPVLMSSEFDGEPWEEAAFQRMWQYSPLAHAHKIKTPTLIIHAENDFRVPIEQAEQFYAFIRRSGGIVEMWRYPRDGHELSRSGEPRNRVARLEKMMGWFDTYCQPEKAKAAEEAEEETE